MQLWMKMSTSISLAPLFCNVFFSPIEAHLLQSFILLSKFLLHICFAPCLCKFVPRVFPLNMMSNNSVNQMINHLIILKMPCVFLNVVCAGYCTCLSIFELGLFYYIDHMFTLKALQCVCNSKSNTIMM